MERAYLLLGVNLGNLEENLKNAIRELTRCGIKILKRSKVYRTKPWGNPNQPDFLNLCLEVEVPYPPDELLGIIKGIEKKMKRTQKERWGPRIIDIDILFYGTQIIDKKDLKIPHPYFFERPFAIIPMAEIAPDFVPPNSSRRIKDLIPGEKNDGIEVYCD